MPDAQPLRSGDPTSLGGYAVLGRLGEGGQGAVFLGRAGDGELVAVKLLHGGLAGDGPARARFVRELEVAKRVARFCTAQVLDADVAGDRPYIVSEYVPGLSLHAVVQQDGPRGGGALERLAVGTLTALYAIHQAGIVHRDFKPHNVMIGPDGPRVIDFGVARALGAAGETQNVGTPAYMAPEHFTGAEITPASDMFAWGTTMVFAANARPAFGNDEMASVMHRILTAEPELGALREPLRGLVAACLDKDPGRRPTARAAQEWLVGGPSGVTAQPETPRPAPAPVPAPLPPPAAAPQRPVAVRPPDPVPPGGGTHGATAPLAPRRGRRAALVPIAAAVAVASVVAGGSVWAATRSSGGGTGGRDAAAAQQGGESGAGAAADGLGGGSSGAPSKGPNGPKGKAPKGPVPTKGSGRQASGGTAAPTASAPAADGGTAPTPARTTAAAEPANKYTPQQACNSGGHGGGYYVQRSLAVSGGRAYLLYNSSGYNCAVTMKTRSVGKSSAVAVWIQRSGGAKVGDSGSYAWYAGPVYVSAAKKCVRFGAGAAAAPYGNCG
ncbi:serine/threonine-protein kinase [Actinomadura parmotrematis]|uniref:serine/threonine-protein kinase n=1 Tax=Actinomadura parmotrematis TaxID=2864039 RepID=UPI00215D7DCE|nr:serine/threonine-protein kinase [Actinomadura parmotrematis]